MNIQDWFPLGWTGWISLQSKILSKVSFNTTVQKHRFSSAQLYSPTLTFIHDYWENHSLTRRTFVGKVMSLLFNMLFRLVITFLPRSKRLLISWLQSQSAHDFRESEVTQSCLTLQDPMDCSPPGSSVHGISQARLLQWGAIAFSCRWWLQPWN